MLNCNQTWSKKKSLTHFLIITTTLRIITSFSLWGSWKKNAFIWKSWEKLERKCLSIDWIRSAEKLCKWSSNQNEKRSKSFLIWLRITPFHLSWISIKKRSVALKIQKKYSKNWLIFKYKINLWSFKLRKFRTLRIFIDLHSFNSKFELFTAPKVSKLQPM